MHIMRISITGNMNTGFRGKVRRTAVQKSFLWKETHTHTHTHTHTNSLRSRSSTQPRESGT